MECQLLQLRAAAYNVIASYTAVCCHIERE